MEVVKQFSIELQTQIKKKRKTIQKSFEHKKTEESIVNGTKESIT